MKETIYTLSVYKLSSITTETSEGINLNTRMKEIWAAPFKVESELMANLLDFTARGFFCRVTKNN